MALTLIEAAKLHSGDEIRRAIIELYARNSSVLQFLPFNDIAGSALKYNREDTLPAIGFRGVNEAYAEGVGVLNPQVESLYIAGGDLDVDNFILETMGEDQRAVHEAMKVKALAYRWTEVFFKGDSIIEPREFDGLQKRVTGAQLIDAGATSGGDQLSLAKLDELLDLVPDANALMMNRALIRRLSQAARNPNVAGHLTYEINGFGQRVTKYNAVPILPIDKDNEGNQILPFTEANPGGGTAASTSIYAARFAEDGVQGIQSGAIQARDLGELQTKSAKRTRVEWFAGIAVMHGESLGRLRGVRDAAVVA